jgi:hypothetical protein
MQAIFAPLKERNYRTERSLLRHLVIWIVIVAASVRWIWPSAGTLSTALSVIVTGGPIVWAADKILRGVNPWRRCSKVVKNEKTCLCNARRVVGEGGAAGHDARRSADRNSAARYGA